MALAWFQGNLNYTLILIDQGEKNQENQQPNKIHSEQFFLIKSTVSNSVIWNKNLRYFNYFKYLGKTKNIFNNITE